MIRILALASALVLGFSAHAAERSSIPEKYRWNLADLYPSEAAWSAARESLAKRVSTFSEYKGRLGDSPQALAGALQAMFAFDNDLSRLGVYAGALADEDTRAARPLEMRQAAEQIRVQFSSATSWIRPEILSLDPTMVRAFSPRSPGSRPSASTWRRSSAGSRTPSPPARSGSSPRRATSGCRASPSSASSSTPTSPTPP